MYSVEHVGFKTHQFGWYTVHTHDSESMWGVENQCVLSVKMYGLEIFNTGKSNMFVLSYRHSLRIAN